MKTAILLIDLQNDYYPGGKYPLWNTQKVNENILCLIEKKAKEEVKIIHIQHIANPKFGIAPFFNQETLGAEIHPDILKAAPKAEIVVKEYADSFHKTKLEQILAASDVQKLLVCGMMTQNCVTHTAISKAAGKYDVSVVADCCTTVDSMLHNIALHALSTRVMLTNIKEL
jgi:nicotinamidase-related amidase